MRDAILQPTYHLDFLGSDKFLYDKSIVTPCAGPFGAWSSMVHHPKIYPESLSAMIQTKGYQILNSFKIKSRNHQTTDKSVKTNLTNMPRSIHDFIEDPA